MSRGLGAPSTGHDGLDRWIDHLRRRLERGDLAGLGPVDVGYGTGDLPAELSIRIMLADLADLDDPAGSWDSDAVWREKRRQHLLDDFRRLRKLIS